MAKFRQNHTRSSRSSASMMIRLIVVAFFLAMIGYYFLQNKTSFLEASKGSETLVSNKETTNADLVRLEDLQVELYDETNQPYFYPRGGKGQLVERHTFSLSYVEADELAEWVAYNLTKKQLQKPNLPRSKWFDEDPDVRTRTSKHSDYTRSGYTRGHLIPAADRSYDKQAMKETFYMSNITPQLAYFNGGIWNELEGQVRNWAYDNDGIIVVTGPIFNTVKKKIGRKTKVSVPNAFYKVLFDYSQPEIKMIGLIIPHEKSNNPLSDFMVPVDEVEAQTGLDFFDDLLIDEVEEFLESTIDKSLWPLDQNLFKRRINEWNK